MCNGEFVIPLHTPVISIPSKIEYADVVAIEDHKLFDECLKDLAVYDLHLECHRTIKGYHRGRRSDHPVWLLSVNFISFSNFSSFLFYPTGQVFTF